jgi:hisD: histidinol dehydrogenase
MYREERLFIRLLFWWISFPQKWPVWMRSLWSRRREKTVKSIRQRWLRQRKRVWMQSIKWAVHRQSQHLLMEPRASRKWIRLWDRAISM